jgi:hypothetical protein
MTMTIYGHVSLSDKRNALNQMGDLFEEDREGAMSGAAVRRCCQGRS